MVKWFHGLKVAQKLTLISVFFMIPDSIMLYLFVNSINQNIEVAKLERAGNQYQRALEPLLDLIPEHRLLLGSVSDRPRDDKAVAAVRERIDAAFVALKRVDARLGPTLDFTPAGLAKRDRLGCDADTVARAWAALRTDSDRAPAEAVERRHLELTAQVRAMIAHAGDNSNLILDPELDSYYLMDVTLLALPETQDRLANIITDGLRRLRAAGSADDERTTLAIDLALLRHDDIDRIQASTQTALRNGNPEYGPNEGIHRNLPPLVKSYAEANERFAALLTRLRAPGPAAVSGAELLAAGRAARQSASDLWHAAVIELDGLLQRRVDAYVYRRTRSLAVAAAAVLAAALLVTFITRSISGPLKKQAAELKIACHTAEAERQRAEDRLVLQQKAEADLRAAQDQLVAASRHAGMAEVATGVLHNVGNVLNSVNVSAHLIKDKVQGSQVTKLNKTADLLDAHSGDMAVYLTADAKGRLIPGYVSQLARLLGGENAAVLAEVDNLSRGIEHIKQVVQFQQGYAKSSTLLEPLRPAELLDDALRLHLIALDRHGVTVVRETADVGLVQLDRHKTLQILVNLVSNAKNAMADHDAHGWENRERRLTLGLATATTEAGERLRLSVSDNGVGIAPENLSRIFALGFTTRKAGHGFGLHSAANAAREMGGTLDVHSAGPGRGATFTLDLPLVPTAVTPPQTPPVPTGVAA